MTWKTEVFLLIVGIKLIYSNSTYSLNIKIKSIEKQYIVHTLSEVGYKIRLVTHKVFPYTTNRKIIQNTINNSQQLLTYVRLKRKWVKVNEIFRIFFKAKWKI
jgi:hypothetical protein